MEKNNKIILGAAAGVGALAAMVLVNRNRRPGFDFAGKTVLIVGGSRGLGLVMARQFLTEGARVAICARDGEELDRASEDLGHYGGPVFTSVCDATRQVEIRRTIDEVKKEFGAVDVLVNDAGIIKVGPLELQTQEDFEYAMQLHFWAPYYAMNEVLPEMKGQRSGRIINISSIGGKVAVPHLSAYYASKFALTGLSSAMRTELVKYGVYVTTVCPGLMRTGSHVNADFKGQNKKEYALFSIMDTLPLTSVSAENAARQILDASRRGSAELTISVQAKLASRLNAVFPETTAGILELVDRFLPEPGTSDTISYTGLESTSAASPSMFTSLIDEAAERNNELRPGKHIN